MSITDIEEMVGGLHAGNATKLTEIVRFAMELSTLSDTQLLLPNVRLIIDMELLRLFSAASYDEESLVFSRLKSLAFDRRGMGLLLEIEGGISFLADCWQGRAECHSKAIDLVSHSLSIIDVKYGIEGIAHSDEQQTIRRLESLSTEWNVAFPATDLSLTTNEAIADYLAGNIALVRSAASCGRKVKLGDQMDIQRLPYLKYCDYLVTEDKKFMALLKHAPDDRFVGRLISCEEFRQELKTPTLPPRVVPCEDIDRFRSLCERHLPDPGNMRI
ncbi:MAG TPA: hypothetical protein PLF13_08145 [candidate division Zixibacteria bacterium]|nr:hypothetical protein [candidate division Zixibacteria bacterium]